MESCGYFMLTHFMLWAATASRSQHYAAPLDFAHAKSSNWFIAASGISTYSGVLFALRSGGIVEPLRLHHPMPPDLTPDEVTRPFIDEAITKYHVA
jgi:hypothetical protein